MQPNRRLWMLAFAAAAAALMAPGRAASQNAAPNTPTVRVTGQVYAQYEFWASDTAGHNNQFDVTRAYLNALGSFTHGISTRLTVDLYRNGASSLNYRLKYAYFMWQPKPTSPVAFRFGMTQTPWIDWEEQVYPFRMQGTIPLERAGYIVSSDLGVGMDFASPGKAINGTVTLMNGEGYQNPSGGKYKDVMGRLSVRLLPSDDPGIGGGLRLTGYGHLGKIDPFGGPRNRAFGALTYKARAFALAAEAGFARTGVTPSTQTPNPPNVDSRTVAGYVVVTPPDLPWQFLGRVERVDPNRDLADDALTRFIAGAAYRLSPNVRLMGDVDAVGYQASTLPSATQAQKTRLLFQTEFVF